MAWICLISQYLTLEHVKHDKQYKAQGYHCANSKNYGPLCTCIWLSKFWNWLLEKSCPYYLIINFVGKNFQLLVVGMMYFFFIPIIIKKRDYSQTYLLIDTFNTCDNYYCDCDNWKFTSQYHFLLS